MLDCPGWSSSRFPAAFIERLGYKVTEDGPESCEELAKSNAFSKMEKLYPQLLNRDRFAEFDAIMIVINLPRSRALDFIIPREFVDELKEKVNIAQKQKGSQIRVVGMNLWLSGEALQVQTDVFEGLFIGQDATEEQIHKCLGGP
jgi:hypothetical protein